MQKSFTLSRRVFLLTAAIALVTGPLLAVLNTTRASAAQLTRRSIRITSSVVSATSVTYNVSFRPTQTTAIEGIVVDFCQNSPLIGIACTKTNGVTGVPTTGTVTVSQTGATPSSVAFNAVAGATAQTGRLLLTHATGFTTASTANDITFSFTATNPSGTISTPGAPGTFYGRFVTYTDDTVANAYDSTATGANNPGTHLDQGGVALSTARQITVNARVQEQLEFCVGAIDGSINSDGTTPANCSAAAFTAGNTVVDLGVIDSVTPVAGTSGLSPVPVSAGGNDRNGAAMIRTNAFNGATVSYFAVLDTGSGRLKVPGATCSGSTGTFDTGSSQVDQCFNSNSDQTHAGNDFTVAGEKFGMTISNVFRPTGSTTTNLTRASDYDGDGTAAGGFAWQESGANDPATTIASSSTVLDYEMLLLRFAARTAATTPTGSYTVTSTYIATPTF